MTTDARSRRPAPTRATAGAPLSAEPRRSHRRPTRRERLAAKRRTMGEKRGFFSLLFGTPRNRDMKRRWPLSLLLFALYFWVGYSTFADNGAPVPWAVRENISFFSAIIHGFTVPFNYFWGLFTNDAVTIYQGPNDTEWYNTGFFLGVIALLALIRFMFRIKLHIVRSKRITLRTPHRPDPGPTR